MNIEGLEAAIAHLPPSDLVRFSQWFEEFMAEQWDKKIEPDISRRSPGYGWKASR